MGNSVVGTLAQDNTDLNLVQSAKEITVDILGNTDFLNQLKGYGVINTQASGIKGDTVTFQNLNRVNSHGLNESADVYANAASSVYGTRELKMGALNYAHAVAKKNTMTQVRADTTIGDLDNGVRDIITQWGKANLIASIMNQAVGNTALSILRSELAETTFTGDELGHVTGLNEVTAVNDAYTFYGNNNAGAPADPSAISSSNYASLVDFMNIEDTIFDVNAGRSIWNGFDMGKGCRALVIIARSNWNQMMLNEPTATAYANIARERYEVLSASGAEKSRATGKEIMGYKVHESIFTPDLKYLVVDDYLLPRCSHAGAEVDNTRTCLILGKHALDMKVGSMLPEVKDGAAFNLRFDDNHEKLNNFNFYKLEMKYGVKRSLINGTGVNADVKYDNAVVLLNLYSPK